MGTQKRILPVVIWAIVLVFLSNVFIFNVSQALAKDLSPPAKPESDIFENASQARIPTYVTVTMKQPLETLIAGESGSFELEASLKNNIDPSAPIPKWDTTAEHPLILWIATPDDSGISFVDRQHPERPRHHVLVRFGLPENADSQVLTSKVEYSVNSRTVAGKHQFWMDIYGELANANGHKFQDMGITRLPFEVDTHLGTKLLMLAVIGVVIFLFIMEWVRVDVIAMAMMVLLPELGLLNAKDTFKGLSSNAVIAIIGVMTISYGLNRAGLVSRMTQPLLKLIGRSSRRLTVLFSGLIAVISSVMQNTGAAVLFLPGIRLATSYRLKIPISRVLMPIGMAAILGGTLTMIGTSPLILLNDILPAGMPKFGFLELTPIGCGLVICGIAYLSTFGLRMLKKHPTSRAGGVQLSAKDTEEGILAAYPLIKGPFEIYVPKNFNPGSRPQSIVGIRRRYMVNIVASAKANGSCRIAPLPESNVRSGYILCVYGPVKAVQRFVKNYGLVLREEPQSFKGNMFNPSMAGIVEGVVSPRSSLIGQTIKEIRFRETFGINALAIHQAGKTYYRQLADRPLQAGDTVLVHGTWEQFHVLENLHQSLIIITPFDEDFHKPEKSARALGCFLVSLFLMILSSFYFQNLPYNPIPLSVCLMFGAVGMVLTRVISINEAYRAVDWRTVFLLGGLIPLGMAVDQTGTAEWIARGIVVGLGSIMSPLVLLIVLAVLSCAFTMVISNVGACTLLVPLGISLANQIGINPRVAAIVVGLGVSNSFILPTHQVNALYMGPGEYRSKDYLKIGSGLALIYITVLVVMTYCFYM